MSSVGPTVLRDYTQCLTAPFEHAPVRLGIGTMVPTSLYSMYIRAGITSNADGTLSIAIAPSISATDGTITGGFFKNNAGAAVATWTATAWTNYSGVSATLVSARVVGGGLRVTPLLPLTSTPGIIAHGDIPGITPTGLTSSTPNALLANVYLKPVASVNCQITATTKPIDATAFAITPAIGTLLGSTTIVPQSWPVVTCNGWPASTTFYCEGVLHLEGISGTDGQLQGYDAAVDPRSSDGWGSYIPSADTIFSAARSAIRDPTLRQALGATARVASQAMASRYGFNHKAMPGSLMRDSPGSYNF
jgi:hypothetical protein